VEEKTRSRKRGRPAKEVVVTPAPVEEQKPAKKGRGKKVEEVKEEVVVEELKTVARGKRTRYSVLFASDIQLFSLKSAVVKYPDLL
jgi:hypothetical protein